MATGCPELHQLELWYIADGSEAAVANDELRAAVKAALGPLKDKCEVSVTWH
jgi:hypothetical protein